MDLTKLSDSDLDALERGDLASVSDEGLAALDSGGMQPKTPREEWKAAINKPASVRLGEAIRDVPRQAGLTGRYAAEGLAQTAEIGTEPIRAVMEMAGAPKSLPLSKYVSQSLTSLGVPEPSNPDERTIGEASKFLAGSAGMIGGARKLAQAGTGLASQIGERMAAGPGLQAASAVGAGGASGAIRESGGSPVEQFGGALLGGLLAPAGMASAAKGVRGGLNLLGDALIPLRAPRDLEVRIEQALRQGGVDWSAVPESVKLGMRQQVADAVKTGGDLNPAAMRRLVDFARVGATPTRGTLTLDPYQITQEKNLSKTGANMTGGGMNDLARIENQNNARLIDGLNRQGANAQGDAHSAGEAVIGSMRNTVGERKRNIGLLYDAAQNSAGRSFSLDHRGFADRTLAALQQANRTGFVPGEIVARINRISLGQEPLTVDSAEQFKTSLGNIGSSSADGNVRAALRIIRQELDNTDVLPAGAAPAPGATPTNQRGLPLAAGSTAPGEEAVAQFNAARAANRQFMGEVEANPALADVYERTAQPDRFVNDYLLGSGASVSTARALRDSISGDQTAMQAVRNSIAQHLKSRALNGAADEVGNFGAAAYRKAMNDIGERKLSMFFDPEEVAMLRSIGNVAEYTLHQPRGSAVNNSNSGALAVAKALGALDVIGQKIPLLGIGPQMSTVARTAQTRLAQNVAPALLARPPLRESLQGLEGAAVTSGLLATPRSERRKDKKRN